MCGLSLCLLDHRCMGSVSLCILDTLTCFCALAQLCLYSSTCYLGFFRIYPLLDSKVAVLAVLNLIWKAVKVLAILP